MAQRRVHFSKLLAFHEAFLFLIQHVSIIPPRLFLKHVLHVITIYKFELLEFASSSQKNSLISFKTLEPDHDQRFQYSSVTCFLLPNKEKKQWQKEMWRSRRPFTELTFACTVEANIFPAPGTLVKLSSAWPPSFNLIWRVVSDCNMHPFNSTMILVYSLLWMLQEKQ